MEILHATSEFHSDEPNGVRYDDVNSKDVRDIFENPKDYIIFDLGGDEKIIQQIGDEIIKYIISKGKYGKSYDWSGIKRIFPTLKDVLSPEDETEFEQGDEDVNNQKNTYYCSEFVAKILIDAGFITLEDLTNLKLENGEVVENEGKYDVNPTEMYELISKIGKKCNLICKKQ